MRERRFFEHSSFLPSSPQTSRLSPAAPASRSTIAITALSKRIEAAISSAVTSPERAALRRSLRQLKDAAALHMQAAIFEALEEVSAALQLVHDSFPGPLQRQVMNGEEVSLTALDAEVTRMLEARARMAVPVRSAHGVAYRKTAMNQSRAAAHAEATLARRSDRY